MLSQIRQNLWLKIVALLTAVLLYGYVQAERDPTISRTLIATVTPQNIAQGLEVEIAEPQVEVTVIGPRTIIDRLKDGDVRAYADLNALPANEGRNALIRLTFVTSNIPKEMAREITFDPPFKAVHFQSFPQQSHTFVVTARYPKDPPAGFRYGRPEVDPATIKVSGRADRMAHVAQIVANAAPTEPGANIDGDFTVSARDMNNKPIDGVLVTPNMVHIKVGLVEEPASKIVTVSPSVIDVPLPPYKISGITVNPNQVRISGRPGKVNTAYTMPTDEISVRDLTENRDFPVNLQLPPDLTVHDLDGHPISKVDVHISISKLAPSTNSIAPGAGTTAAPTAKP